ncbi:ArsR family transcriptional regulator [Patescibacteria group bacterium]|nr:MAG: ArsR family transcriptional regulator [Patescibacteria group bacterium]
MKKYRELELIAKGFANHRRIQVLELLSRETDVSLVEIADRLKMNVKTASDHVRRMVLGGLVWKKTAGNMVYHTLSPRGKSILVFLRKLE